MRPTAALVALLAAPCASWQAASGLARRPRRTAVRAALDLKPAFEVFTSVPSARDMRKGNAHVAAPGAPVLSYAELPDVTPRPDPFELVSAEIAPFSDAIAELVEMEHPVLSRAASHFFQSRQGKRFRPTIVMLVSKALSALPPPPKGPDAETAYAKHAGLGQITEMIHVASLVHDDVLDDSDTRRGGDSIHKMYTNKVAVMTGDYLLARASVLLARLQNTQVVQVMSTALDSLVQGEIMQAQSGPEDMLDMSYYLKKSYYKTASLICDACKSSALIAGHSFHSDTAVACEEFGFHIGLSYQIVDDILDFTASDEELGKPAMADVSLGLATAPLLYAAEADDTLTPIIKRRFKEEGDAMLAYDLVQKTDGVERAKELALYHAQKAVNAICRLPESEHRNALVMLAHIVLTRRK